MVAYLTTNVLIDIFPVEIPPKVSKQYFAFIFTITVCICIIPLFLILNSYMIYLINTNMNFSNLFNIFNELY